MKKFISALMLIFTSVILFSMTSMSDPPLKVGNRSDYGGGQKNMLLLELPYRSGVQTANSKIYAETGTSNLMYNSEFEALVFSDGWTSSSPAFTKGTTTDAVLGSSLCWDPTAASQTMTGPLVDIPNGIRDGNLEDAFYFKSNDSDYQLRILDISNNVLYTFNLPNTAGAFQLISFGFPGGSKAALKSQIISGSNAGKICQDNHYMGPNRNVGTSNSVYVPWTDYATTISADSGTITNYTLSAVQWMRQGENAYYRGKLTFTGSPGTWASPRVYLPTGQNMAFSVRQLNPIPSSIGLTRLGVNTYLAQASQPTSTTNYFNIKGFNAGGAGSAAINQAAPATWASSDYFTWDVGPIKISEWTGTSETILRLNALPNTTAWVAYTPTFQNLGTPTAVDVKWRKVGQSIQIQGRWTNGTVAGGSATFSLPSGLTGSLTNDIIVGNYGHQGSATGTAVVFNVAGGDLRFGMTNWGALATGTNMTTGAFTSVNLELPITGWTASTVDMPLVKQSMTCDDQGVCRTVRASVNSTCSSNPCTLAAGASGISSIAWGSTGTYTVNFSPAFSAAPVCIANVGGGASIIGVRNNETASNWAFQSFSGGSPANASLSIICTGPK